MKLAREQILSRKTPANVEGNINNSVNILLYSPTDAAPQFLKKLTPPNNETQSTDPFPFNLCEGKLWSLCERE